MPVIHHDGARARDRHSDRDSLPDADSDSESRRDSMLLCVQCLGCGQQFEPEAVLRRHRNSGRMASAKACRGAASSGPKLSASGSIRRSTGAGNPTSISSRGDISDLFAGDDSDDSAQEYEPPSMQVETDVNLTMSVHILLTVCTNILVLVFNVHTQRYCAQLT